MFALPSNVVAVLVPFERLFTAPTFRQVSVLFAGAILTPGQRTITACLRAVGLSQHTHFQNFHRTLNRARWSPRRGARILLELLLRGFPPPSPPSGSPSNLTSSAPVSAPVILGLDDTIERRRGAKIQAKGIYRDPVRSSHGHFVKCSGLRWLCLMLLRTIPFARRIWALPFFSTLCPSERFFQQHRQPREPKKLTDWARQMLLQVRRWFPHLPLMVVADSSFAVGELLWDWSRPRRGGPPGGYAPIHAITRLRLDAALHKPTLPRPSHQKGRPRKKGDRLPTPQQVLESQDTRWQCVEVEGWYSSEAARRTRTAPTASRTSRSQTSGGTRRKVEICTGTAIWASGTRPLLPIRWVLVRDPEGQFEPQALLCTDLNLQPIQILTYFVQRWQVEVTFHEAREHLGLETQRQWNAQAIERTTPLLLALFSLVTLLAHRMTTATPGTVIRPRCSAWYSKPAPTFADAMAWVRRELWLHPLNLKSLSDPSVPPAPIFDTSVFDTDVPKMGNRILACMLDLLCYAP